MKKLIFLVLTSLAPNLYCAETKEACSAQTFHVRGSIYKSFSGVWYISTCTGGYYIPQNVIKYFGYEPPNTIRGSFTLKINSDNSVDDYPHVDIVGLHRDSNAACTIQ